jgi:hypothetical protein
MEKGFRCMPFAIQRLPISFIEGYHSIPVIVMRLMQSPNVDLSSLHPGAVPTNKEFNYAEKLWHLVLRGLARQGSTATAHLPDGTYLLHKC